MFVRWKRRQRSRRRRPTGEWVRAAYLVASERVDGLPRQRVVAYLGSIREGHEGQHWHRVDFWAAADKGLGSAGLDDTHRAEVELALAGVVARPDADPADGLRRAEALIAASQGGISSRA